MQASLVGQDDLAKRAAMVEQVDLGKQATQVVQVDLADVGHQVVSDGPVGPAVEWGQVVPGNRFDLKQDHKMILADVQHLEQWDIEAAWVVKVGIAPQDHILALVGTPVDL